MASAKKVAGPKGQKRSAYFKIEDSKVATNKKYCPRCGPGVMLADHKDRTTCGKCGYTEFRK
ncbi:MAG: 30S ribosomal protein S27ae [Methanoregula sp.]|jgi:small subunit ribosomal protein S27Ae